MNVFHELLRSEWQLHSTLGGGSGGEAAAALAAAGPPSTALAVGAGLPPPKDPSCAVCSRPHGPFIVCSRADCGREYHRHCLRETRLYTPRQPGWVCPPCRQEQGWGVSLEELQLSLDDPQLTQLVLPHMATLGCLVSATAKRHSDTCTACGKMGELLLCDGCPRAFHHACSDVAHVPLAELEDTTWFCAVCKAESARAAAAASTSGGAASGASASSGSSSGSSADAVAAALLPSSSSGAAVASASAITTAPSVLADQSNLPPRVAFEQYLTTCALFNAQPPQALVAAALGVVTGETTPAYSSARGGGVAASSKGKGKGRGRKAAAASSDEEEEEDDDDDDDDDDSDDGRTGGGRGRGQSRGQSSKGGRGVGKGKRGGKAPPAAASSIPSAEPDPAAAARLELFYDTREVLGQEVKRPKKAKVAAAAPPKEGGRLSTFSGHVGLALEEAEAEAWVTEPPQYNKIRRCIYLCPKPKLARLPRDLEDRCACKAHGFPCDHRCENRATYRECTRATCSYDADEEGVCQNRRVQRRAASKVAIRPTPGKGWGLFAAEDIKTGDFLVEYVGEIIDDEECGRRNEESKREGTIHVYMMQLSPELVIDAARYGNESRFINHSCQPNCATEKWEIAGEIRACIFAKHDIPAGTELTYDYEFESFAEERWECQCGEPGCRGFLGVSKREALDAAAMEAAGLAKASSELRHNAKAAAVVAAAAAEGEGGAGGAMSGSNGALSPLATGGSGGFGAGSSSGRSPRGAAVPAWRLGPVKTAHELALYCEDDEEGSSGGGSGSAGTVSAGLPSALAALHASTVPSTQEALFIRRQRLFLLGMPPARRNLFVAGAPGSPARPSGASSSSSSAVPAAAKPASSPRAGHAGVVPSASRKRGTAAATARVTGPAWHRRAWEALAARLDGAAGGAATSSGDSTLGAWPGLSRWGPARPATLAGKKRPRSAAPSSPVPPASGTPVAVAAAPAASTRYTSSHYPALAADAIAAAKPAGRRLGLLFARYARLVELLSRMQHTVQTALPADGQACLAEDGEAAFAAAFGSAAAAAAGGCDVAVPLAPCPDAVLLSSLASRLWEWAAGIFTEGGSVSEDDLLHDISCSKCWGTGSVVCCDTCSRVWHPACLGMMEHQIAAVSNWSCPECLRSNSSGGNGRRGGKAGARGGRGGSAGGSKPRGRTGAAATAPASTPTAAFAAAAAADDSDGGADASAAVLAPLLAAAEAAAAAAASGASSCGAGTAAAGSRVRRSAAVRGSAGFPPVVMRALWHLAAAARKPLPVPLPAGDAASTAAVPAAAFGGSSGPAARRSSAMTDAGARACEVDDSEATEVDSDATTPYEPAAVQPPAKRPRRQ